MENDIIYREEQCVSSMYPHCSFCSHTCQDRYKDFLKKGVQMSFISTSDEVPNGILVQFYKEENKWYANVVGHTKEDNEMVFGADTLLEYLSNGTDKISLLLTDKQLATNPIVLLTIDEHDEYGATYTVTGQNLPVDKIWICNVTHDVLGEHPNIIFVYTV